MPEYDEEYEERPRIREVPRFEKVRERVGEVAGAVAGVFEAISPRFIVGITSLAVGVIVIGTVASSYLAVSPYIQSMLSYMVPVIIQMSMAFIFLSVVALMIGVVRRLV